MSKLNDDSNFGVGVASAESPLNVATQEATTIEVNAHNEWDPLEELIIGIADNCQYPTNDFSWDVILADEEKQLPNLDVKLPPIPPFMIEETKEDLNIFAEAMKKLGVKVHRPNPIDTNQLIKTPYWESNQYFNYCPRDILLVVGDTIIETASYTRSRYFESFSYRDILMKCMYGKSPWIAAPKPLLREEDYNLSPNGPNILNNLDPIFDAANVIRAGKDLFYLLSGSGNKAGLQWLRNTLGKEYRVHACPDLYQGIHIDSTIALLRPGLALINPARVNEDNLPEYLKKWDLIYTPEMVTHAYSDFPPMSSKWLGMNLLMVNPSLAVVDAHQTALIKLLEKNGIDVLPLVLRHGMSLGGGFHCVTLDVKRKGKKEDYFT